MVMVMTERLSVTFDYDTIRVRFNGMLHVCVPRRALAIQSWRSDSMLYSIEYTMPSGATVLSEYDREEDWRFILSKLDEIL